jgi:hypothetical protein
LDYRQHNEAAGHRIQLVIRERAILGQFAWFLGVVCLAHDLSP